MARRGAASSKASGRGKAPSTRASSRGPSVSKKRSVEAYDHKEAQRLNNPPVGLVNPASDRQSPPAKYQFDRHADPVLNFDRQGAIEQALERQMATLEASVAELAASVPDSPALGRAREALAKLRAMRGPYLNWAGKAEHTSFEVPTVSLHVHEKIEPQRIISEVRRRNGTPKQGLLFDKKEENPPLSQAIDFYGHKHGWSNRLVAGDSLLVMNSLLQKEGMAGKVQMVYIDPPYGIKYGSNFQPFVNKREVKDGKDEDLTQEPEMVRAFRDAWTYEIHSYLTFLRDRFLLSRELLADTGSIFVQISDDNVHRVRALLEEVFGSANYVSTISYSTTGGFASTRTLSRAGDYVLWFARNKQSVKYRQLYADKPQEPGQLGEYDQLELADGTRRPLSKAEKTGVQPFPVGSRVFTDDNPTSQGEGASTEWFEYEGKKFHPGAGNHWKAPYPTGMERLADARRFMITPKGKLRYVRYLEDFPFKAITNLWTDIAGAVQDRANPKIYVVQTSNKIIERCLLMASDPGDLVLDPTCGSGTTAFVAEQWGRRWITCDTSRVAVTLAKQRLMTADFVYYKLLEETHGVVAGIECEQADHVKLGSIANNPELRNGLTLLQIRALERKYAERTVLVDRPVPDEARVRVTGPFTVEAVPAAVGVPEVVSPGQVVQQQRVATLTGNPTLPGLEKAAGGNPLGLTVPAAPVADSSVARTGETRRQAELRAELLASGVRAKGGQKITFSRVEPVPGLRSIHAEAETKDAQPKRVVISFGPEHGPVDNRQVDEAWREAFGLMPKPDILIFAGFQFDPDAASDIDAMDPKRLGMQVLKVQMNTDLLTSDLKKARSSNESFWLIGQPDVLLRKATADERKTWSERMQAGSKADKTEDLRVVEVHGFDYYDPRKGEVESHGSDKIAMWMLDTDFDGRALYPAQVFFPMADKEKEGWGRLAASLRAEVDSDLIEQFRGTVSLPFRVNPRQRVAVKIIDDRGIESLKVMEG